MTDYYVDPSGGSDANAGTSFGAAWATTQKAADTAVAGDVVRLCKTATETVSAPIDFDTNNGTVSSMIRFVSYNSTGTTSEDGYTIQASASIASVINIPDTDYIRFRGVVFDANSNATDAVLGSNTGSGFCYFRNCDFKNATAAGVSILSQQGWYFLDCNSFSNNVGLFHGTSNRGLVDWHGGSLHDNTTYGWRINRTDCTIKQCAVYDNGSHGFFCDSNSARADIINCTFYGNGGDGVSMFTSAGRDLDAVIGCTFVGNGGYGIKTNSVNYVKNSYYNHSYGNTSGDEDVSGTLGEDLIGGDPLFTSVTDGAEDFAPLDGSPLDGTGVNGSDIGAVGSLDPTGGGGTVGFAL